MSLDDKCYNEYRKQCTTSFSNSPFKILSKEEFLMLQAQQKEAVLIRTDFEIQKTFNVDGHIIEYEAINFIEGNQDTSGRLMLRHIFKKTSKSVFQRALRHAANDMEFHYMLTLYNLVYNNV